MTGRQAPPSAYQQLESLIIIALWFGLLTGLGEVSIRALQRFFLREFIYVSPDVVWMAPLADMVIFAIAGLILFLIARRWPELVSLRIAIFVFAFLGLLGPLLWFPRLHPYAGLLLAAGLAVQTARFLAAYPKRFYLLVRHTTAWMLALVVGMAVVVHGWGIISERRALAKLPHASPDTPNVLLIVLDTVRAKSLSLYGYERPTTPYLEKLAETGVVFEHAFSTSSWTLPSHASMFTGRFPHETSADWETPLDAAYPTLAEIFRAHGYATAGFVANLLYCTYESGLNRGFIHYADYPVSWRIVMKSSWLARTISEQDRLKRDAEEVKGEFLSWISQNSYRPFFAFLNFMEAHEPYLAPPPFDRKFSSKGLQDRWLVDDRKYTEEEIREFRNAYDGAVAHLDHQIGLLFDELEKRSVLENTLVIITSDHGEEFGEHGLMGHGNSLYLTSLHVPLLISLPSRVPAGRRVLEPVTLRDLPATVSDLLRIKSPFPGASLAHYWEAPGHSNGRGKSPFLSEVNFAPDLPEWFPVSKGDMKALALNGYHYIRNGDGREELYNHETDPWETRDLARSEGGHRALEGLRESLRAILARK